MREEYKSKQGHHDVQVKSRMLHSSSNFNEFHKEIQDIFEVISVQQRQCKGIKAHNKRCGHDVNYKVNATV